MAVVRNAGVAGVVVTEESLGGDVCRVADGGVGVREMAGVTGIGHRHFAGSVNDNAANDQWEMGLW